MIKNIIDLLNLADHYKVSKEVDIAKGYYQIPKSFSKAKKQLIRIFKSK